MSIDMVQFHQVFFEESFEGLDEMESGLLNLDIGDLNVAEINTIFRAAHSIKGGSGTFGFSAVSDFTHVMETLLDEMRDGRRKITQSAVNVLLGAVDCLRQMLNAIQDESPVDEQNVTQHKMALEQELKGESLLPLVADSDAQTPIIIDTIGTIDETLTEGWVITFNPHKDMLKSGTDPVRLFRELAKLGEFSVEVDLHALPDVYSLDPEECYLSWKLTLMGDVPLIEIEEVFAWVDDLCDFSIQPLLSPGQAIQTTDPEKNKASEIIETATESAFSVPVQSVDSSIQSVTRTHLNATTDNDGAKSKGSSSIRVDTDKIDTLINMVGELVITQSMLSLVGEHFDLSMMDQLKHGLSQLERHTRELQESVMNIRMLPISFVFSRFPRLVHDLSSKLGKKIELELIGENTEVDKTVVELLSDPLVHLVRNSLDHGIEMPEERLAAGKPETGKIVLEAYHRGGNIVIEVIDDGRGLDKNKLRSKALEKGLIGDKTLLTDQQTFELIFMPGFTTAEQLTDLSGRGVGMDVVRKNIQALGGNIEILSEPGQGSTISIHLPLTLAILDGQSIAVGNERFIVPLGSIIESINVDEKMVNRVAGKGETFRLRDEFLPIIRMHEIFNVQSAKATKLTDGLLVVVEGQGVRCGLFVDDLLSQQQVVIKSLEANYRRIEGVSGATILGDGSVALILDIPGLLRLSNQ
jgi:two-component system, chemotaxis family, sensor kinase CheA